MTATSARSSCTRPSEPPGFLAIGHVARDLQPGGHTIGGAVTYAALTAQRMGLCPAVVTSLGPDVDSSTALPGIPVHVVPAAATTTFRNTYRDGRRKQRIEGMASRLGIDDVPEEWRAAPLVMLAPLAGEVDGGLATAFPNATVLASLQGWLRRWDDEGLVSPAYWAGGGVLPHVDAAVLSVDDLGSRDWLEGWRRTTPVLIVTAGVGGSVVYSGGRRHDVRAFPVREVDPTGAGDVFGAAYLIRYAETGDVLRSAEFASCAASFCVEAQGSRSTPSRAGVEARLSTRRRQ